MNIDPNSDSSLLLHDAQKSVYGFDKNIKPTMAMIELQKLSVTQGMKYLESQICTGGIIDPRCGFRRPLAQAITHGLISRTVREEIECHPEELKFNIEGEKMTLTNLFEPENEHMLVRKTEPVHFLKSSAPTVEMECIYLVCKRKAPIKTVSEVTFETAWHKPCPLESLANLNLVSPESVDILTGGYEDPEDRTTKIFKEEIRPWIMGNPMPIAGVILSHSGERLNFREVVERGIMKWGFARSLQEAQASNGFIIDPVDGKTYSVDDAVKLNLVKENHANILRRAEKGATCGYEVRGPDGEDRIVGFIEAVKLNIINPDHCMRMLEVQKACGGIIDPRLNHRLPNDVLKAQLDLSDELIKRIDNDDDDTKGYYDINTGENLTYLQLIKRCVRDEITNLPMIVDHRKSATDTAPVRTTMTIPEIEKALENRFNQPISIDDIKVAKIFNEDVISRLENKNVRPSELESLYPIMEDKIKGTACIAGVIDESGQEFGLRDAAENNIIANQIATTLIEAQAACGNIMHPVNGAIMDVGEALKQNLIPLSAKSSVERAYNIGFKGMDDDGTRLSITQAIEGKRIAERAGLRYLDAQEVAREDALGKTNDTYDLGDSLGRTLDSSTNRTLGASTDSATPMAKSVGSNTGGPLRDSTGGSSQDGDEPSESTNLLSPIPIRSNGARNGNAAPLQTPRGGNSDPFRTPEGSLGGSIDDSFRGSTNDSMHDATHTPNQSGLSPGYTSDDSRLSLSDLSKSVGEINISGGRHMSSEAPAPSPAHSPTRLADLTPTSTEKNDPRPDSLENTFLKRLRL